MSGQIGNGAENGSAAFIESNELLRGQNQVLERIAQNRPLAETLDLLVRLIEAQSAGMLASILLLDPDGIHVRHGAAPSLPESFNRAVDGEPIGPRAGSCGTAAFRREPVIVEDIATDPLWEDYRGAALENGLRACWSTPIFDSENRVLGTFALYFRTPGRPTKRHRKLIEIATYTAAIALIKHREHEALRCSEERLRLALAAGNLRIWEVDIPTGKLRWSDKRTAMADWSATRADQNITAFWDAIHPADRSSAEARFRTAVAEHSDYEVEYRIVRRDGSQRWMVATGRAEYDPAGAPLRMVGVAQDITDRKRADEEIKRREAQLSEAQRIAQMGSYEWDIVEDKVHRSDALCRIFGVTQSDFEPTFAGYLARVHPDDRSQTKDTIEQAHRERKSFDFEERIIRPDGSVRVLNSRGHWMLDKDLRPVKLLGTCQDITDRKETEQHLRVVNARLADELKARTRTEQQIQALSARLISAQEEERGRLARELHDDLSQQIAAVSIAVSNFKKGITSHNRSASEESERIQHRLVQLAESVRRLSHKLHPAALQYAGLAAALREYCSEYGTLAGIRISFQAGESFEGVAPAIALCIYRVAQEALRNIAKHAKVDEATVVLKRQEGVLFLTVSDHGVGMQPGGTTAQSGLGLISIKERARLVHGTVDIQSEPNEGTTVTLIVPVSG